MGLLKNIVTAPFKPIEWVYRKIIPEKDKIRTVIPTRYTEEYAYFFEPLESTAVVIGGQSYLIVWEKGVSDKDKEKILKKLQEVS
jgi:hypothetical protein